VFLRRQWTNKETTMAARKVRLAAVRIEGFRSCERTTFHPDMQLSALIGPNSAGKTNILQALTLLGAWNGRSRYRRGETAVSQCRVLAEFLVGKTRVALRSTIGYAIDDDNTRDVVDVNDEWRLGSMDGSAKAIGKWYSMPPEFLSLRGSAYSIGDITVARRYMIRNYTSGTNIGISHEKWPKKLSSLIPQILAFRSKISYYSASQFTNPASCPTSIEIDAERDQFRPGTSRRKEHQGFLSDLYRVRQTNKEKYAAYLSLIGKQGLNLVSTLRWKELNVASREIEVRSGGKIVKRKRQRILIVPSVQSGADRLSFSQLSEGTFKTLALVFYLVTDSNELLLIEEPEVCVHHGLLASIVELIKSQSTKKQIMFSTHSDFVLDQLEPEQVFSVSRGSRSGTRVRGLSRGYSAKKIEALKEFLHSSGNLGEYWRQGGFDD
jgi:ABC-type uncharacterized transport system ATPase subunit